MTKIRPAFCALRSVMRSSLVVFVFFLLTIRIYAQTPCDCTNCPQFMPDGFTGSFFIQVMNASNPTLGQNGQGVCGVHLVFDHEYLGDLQITLTSPSGQSVTLIGPIGLFGPTDFTTWDVTFLPCGDPVTPDPGFSNVWSNNQPWGLFGNYTGTYYPNSGCLENFNSGPVNGTWTLTVVDGQAVDVGNFTNYEIIFCDPSGIDCFSCAANGGNLTQPDVVACEGSNNLNLNLPPTYTPQSPAPPSPEYEYTYIISGAGGIIQAIDPVTDLSTYPAGSYSVCGLSYLATQANLIPDPNGALTVTQLTNALNSSQPPFCGDVTPNCVNVVINPIPENVEEDQTVCSPACVLFYGTTYCQTGTYVKNLTQNGCPYTATLHLTANQPKTVFLNETICDGGCSSNPAFPGACSAGTFQETLQTTAGCDSNLILTVTVLNVTATIVPPAQLGCGQNSAPISGAGSTTGLGTSYLWTASNGGTITGNPNLINTTIGSPGDYQLKVCRNFNGAFCCDSASVTVTVNNNPPATPGAISGGPNVCLGQPATFSVAAVPGTSTYLWTLPTGVSITSGQNTNSITVLWNNPNSGNVCVSAVNACGTSPATCQTINVIQPVSPLTPNGNANACAGGTELYQIPTIAGATTYTWTVTAPASIVSGQGSNQIVVNWGPAGTGDVCVSVGNNCGQSQPACLPVTVSAPPSKPAINGSNNVCAGSNQNYAVPGNTGATIFNWTITGGTITSGNGSAAVQVTWDANATSGSICVVGQNSCGVSVQTCLNVSISPALPLPLISGPAQVCSGASNSYVIQPVAGATGYSWTVPAGAAIIFGQNTDSIVVQWNTAPGGDVCVQTNSTCGAGPQQCFPVAVAIQPIAFAGADGNICGLKYTLAAAPNTNGSTGTWNLLTGPGTASFINAASDTTDVVVNTYGVYQFVRKLSNAGCTDQDTVSIHFNSAPLAGQLMPDCDANNQNYTIQFQINGGTPPYIVTGGGLITGNQFTSNLIPSGQPYTFTISDANGCTSPTIAGTTNCNCTTNAGNMSLQLLNACEGNTLAVTNLGNFNLDGNDVGSYFLHSNSGPSLGTVYDQNTTGIFGYKPGMTYGVNYYVSYVVGNNLNGLPDLLDPCLSVSQGQPVVFYQNPIANAGANLNGCGLELDLSGNPGVGAWSVVGTPPGATVQFDNSQSATVHLSADSFGVYTLRWTLNNNGCTGSDDVDVQFLRLPAAGFADPICDASNENYAVNFTITTGQSPFTVNGAPVSGNNFSSTFFPNGTPYNLIITDANNCNSAPITGNFNCDCATNAGQMSLQPLIICEGDTASAQFLGNEHLDGNDTLLYVLHTGSGKTLGLIVDQNNTGVFAFKSGMIYGYTYYISTVAGSVENGIVDFNDLCLSVAQGQPVVFYQNPIPIAGSDPSFCGLSGTLGATGLGTWSILNGPSGGNLILSNPQNPLSACTSNLPGTYLLEWTVQANGCVATDQIQLNFYDLPAVSAPQFDCDPTNEFYTVSYVISNGTAPYTIGGTTLGGANFTSSALSNGQPYNFTLTDANGCSAPAISGNHACNCSTSAGTLSQNLLEVCEGGLATAIAQGDESLDPNDVSIFVLHTGSGNTLGQVFDQNTTGIFSFQPGMAYEQTYYISLVAGTALNGVPNPADPCLSVAIGQPVVFHKNPTPFAGSDGSICGLSFQLAASNTQYNGLWQQISGPQNASISTPNATQTQAEPPVPGTYKFSWTETNKGCIAADTIEIQYFDVPTASIDLACNPTYTAYSIQCTISGGTMPYAANGISGAFAGNVFTSDLLPDKSPYSFVFTDGNGCATPLLDGTFDCQCITNAGKMLGGPLVFCANTPATAVWNNSPTLDADDAVQFILHTTAGSNLGNILASNSTPTFDFTNNLQTGVVYYISAIAGSATNGIIDLNDPCLNIAAGTPVRWKPMPSIAISGDTAICAGTNVQLQFKAQGAFPLSLQYSLNAGGVQSLNIQNSQPISIPILSDSSLIFNFLRIKDNTNPSCETQLNDTVRIQVRKPVNAGVPNEPLELCAGSDLPIQLSNLLNGADFGGLWSDVSFIPVQGGQFTPSTGTFQTGGQIPGTYRFQYLKIAQAPCPSDTALVEVQLQAVPVADAGEDKTLNCNQTQAVLGGPGTTPGVQYAWDLNGNPSGTEATLVVGAPGDYQLKVTSSAGCTAIDQVTVLLDAELPVAKKIRVQNVRCFGEKNGSIQLDSIVSTHPPVLFSLNGGPFNSIHAFNPLAPGIYRIRLQDANGCEWETDTLKIMQAPKLTVSLGTDLVVHLGDTATLTAQSSLPLNALKHIQWSPLRDTIHEGQLFQEFRPLKNEQIGIQIQDTNGCIASDRIQIIVKKLDRIYIPNIIKPDSDNNAFLTVYAGNEVTMIHSLQIFDRWGSKVFEAFNFEPNSESIHWDGKFNGADVNPGVYVYYVVAQLINGEKMLVKGDVTVYR